VLVKLLLSLVRPDIVSSDRATPIDSLIGITGQDGSYL